MPLMKTIVSVATLLTRRQAESSPSVAIFFENVVMNAVDRAPSAKRSRNMLGTRNAIKKASRFFPAPKSAAKSTSRIRPRTRLDRMAMPTTPVARVLTRFVAGIAASFTDATEQWSRVLRKRNQPRDTRRGNREAAITAYANSRFLVATFQGIGTISLHRLFRLTKDFVYQSNISLGHVRAFGVIPIQHQAPLQ